LENKNPQTTQGGLENRIFFKSVLGIILMKELDKNMYFGAKPVTIETAKLLRNKTTY
jgi:hypothetical protein